MPVAFTVGDNVAGKTLKDLFRADNGSVVYDPKGVDDNWYATSLGIDNNYAFKSGDVLSFNDQNNREYLNSAGYKNMVKAFGSPIDSGQARLNQQQKEATALAEKQKAETDARFGANKKELGDFVTRYGEAVPKIIEDTYKEFNVGDLLGYANALNSRISELKGNTNFAGAGGYANAGQVDAAVNTNFLPRFLTASDNANRAASIASSQVNARLSPYQTEAQLINDRMAREMTGYSTLQQNELTTLLEKMRQQGSLTLAEYNRATQLEIQENEFEARKQELEQKYKYDKDLQSSKPSTDTNKYMSLGNDSVIFDTSTGKFTQNPYKTGSSSSGGGDWF